MSKKVQAPRKVRTRQPVKTPENVLSPSPGNVTTLAEREAAVLINEQAVVNRAKSAVKRENTANQREVVADRREVVADRREESADLREEAADLREEVATLRDRSHRDKEHAARAKASLSARTEAQLREANERLVVATMNAQTMAETAEQATEKMSYMAEHDFLTGLPNRTLLTDRLVQSIAFALRHGKKVALIYLDLDHFKHINDSLGHEVGDKLLQSVAKRLQSCVRLSDTVSRQGGDEFVVLLPEIEQQQDATLIAQKLIESMTHPHLISGHRLHVTISIGISIYPDDGKNVEELVRNADTAMYQAKKRGRNTYQLFTPDMNVRAVARQAVEQALYHGLEHRKFVLYYQPKVNLETGAITGAEALVRLLRADRRPLSPTKFVSIAEECGLILPIGKWVLHEACRQTQTWLQAGLNLGQIAVNVSAREFHSNDYIAGVRAILDDTGLDPHCLELEVTEGVLMQDTEHTMSILHELKELGVQIALDDFGTGYSSLSYLSRFPIDTLKIDQSFVQDINGDAGEAIVSAVIGIGTSLKQRVVAEGIETKQQLDFLQSHHCDEGQGYYFGRPVTAEKFAALLVAGH